MRCHSFLASLVFFGGVFNTSALASPRLTFFRQETPTSCVWESVLMEASKKKEVLATMNFSCADMAFIITSLNYKKGVGTLEFKDGKSEPVFWEVHFHPNPLQANQMKSLPSDLDSVGVSDAGHFVSYTVTVLNEPIRTTKKESETIRVYEFLEKKYEFTGSPIGVPGMASLFVRDAKGIWQRKEVAQTTTDACETLGALALSAEHGKIRRAVVRDSDQYQKLDPKKDAAILKQVSEFSLSKKGVEIGGQENVGEWTLFSQPGMIELLTYHVDFGPGEDGDAGLILYREPGAAKFQPLKNLGFKANELVNTTIFEHYLLANAGDSFMQIYDLRTGEIVFEARNAISPELYNEAI